MTMQRWAWYVWAVIVFVKSLALVTDARREEALQLDQPLNQSQIDQILHNQIIEAGLSPQGLGVSEGRNGRHFSIDDNGGLVLDLEGTVKALQDTVSRAQKKEKGNKNRNRDGNRNRNRDRNRGQRRRDAKICTTPSGGEGLCLDLSDCPALILDFNALRKSVCFKSLFRPGVCCPVINKDPDPTTTSTTTTQKPTPTTKRTTSKPTTTARPKPTTARPKPTTAKVTTNKPSTTSTTTTTTTTTPRPRPNPPVPSPYPCGQAAVRLGRIINGTETYPGEWPWAASIWLHGNRKTEFWCGGSLISKRYIMTAAHCTRDSKGKTFSPLQFSIRLGDHNIFSTEDDAISHPQTYRVSNIKLHPDFKAHGFYNDLALLKLDRDVDFTNYIVPVCLPSDQMAQQPLDHLQGYMPTVVGWGKTRAEGGKENPTLLKTRVPIWRNDPCDKAYFQPIEKIFLCAGFIEGGTDACQGDSGGPLTLYTGREWTQIGIVSFGNGCAKADQPGVYTRLTEFLPWIKTNADMV